MKIDWIVNNKQANYVFYQVNEKILFDLQSIIKYEKKQKENKS
jgi:hypothetical protein